MKALMTLWIIMETVFGGKCRYCNNHLLQFSLNFVINVRLEKRGSQTGTYKQNIVGFFKHFQLYFFKNLVKSNFTVRTQESLSYMIINLSQYDFSVILPKLNISSVRPKASECGIDNSPISVVYEGFGKIETYPWLGTLLYPLGIYFKPKCIVSKGN